MSVGARVPVLWLATLLSLSSMAGSAACSRTPKESTVAPTPAPDTTEAGEAAPFEQNTYVSTDYNADGEEGSEPAKKAASKDPQFEGFAVTTAERAKEVAEEAVSEQLDPDRTWALSPVLPAAWPAKEPSVAVLFYPMAPNPPSLTEYQLYTPAFRVTVSLADASTEIKTIGKRRKLGTIKRTRPSSLEKRELDLAEASLVKQMLGGQIELGQRPYWGYLKFIHEHPKMGRDMERRASKFIGHIRRKHGK